MLDIFVSPSFYSKYVSFPGDDFPVPTQICNNPKRWPYFRGAIGALDGSHIHAFPPAAERHVYHNCKGFVSQNCLFACGFDLQFTYSLTSWEGSMTDARLWDQVLEGGLKIPAGKYLLADAGFPSCEQLLIPYCSVRYHLAEWGCANVR